MAFVPLVPIGEALGKLVDERTATDQRAALAALEERLRSRRAEVHAGWGPAYVDRVHKKGKLTARERLERLADPGTRTFEVGMVLGGMLYAARPAMNALGWAYYTLTWPAFVCHGTRVCKGAPPVPAWAFTFKEEARPHG